MPTLIEIQNESGPLWLEIQSAITAAALSRENEWKANNDAVRVLLDEANTKLQKSQDDAEAARLALIAEHEKTLASVVEDAKQRIENLVSISEQYQSALHIAEESLADHQAIAAKAIADATGHMQGLMSVLAVAGAPVKSRAEKAKAEALAQLDAEAARIAAEKAKLEEA